jgi:hypothetical protein
VAITAPWATAWLATIASSSRRLSVRNSPRSDAVPGSAENRGPADRSCPLSHRGDRGEALERAERIGNQGVAADLVTREVVAVQQEHTMAGAGDMSRDGRAGRSGAGHDDVPFAVRNNSPELRSEHDEGFSAMK